MMDSFYIVLPSNSGDYEGNTTSKFTVRLPDTLELDSNWTVALSNLIFPFSFSMLDEEDGENSSIVIYRRIGDVNSSFRVEIPDLFYKHEEALGSAINSILMDVWEKELQKEGKSRRRGRAVDLPTEEEGPLITPGRVEESEETKKAVEAFLAAKRRLQPKQPIQQQEEKEPPLEEPGIVDEEDGEEEPKKLEEPRTVEESEETKKAVDAFRQRQQQQQPKPPSTTLKTPAKVQESEEVRQRVQQLIDERQKASQTPMDGKVTPIPPDTPAPKPKGFEPELQAPLLDIAKRAAERAWRESTEYARKAQAAQEQADHHFTLARLKYARKDYVETASGTGEPIQVRKTPEHIAEWVREQIEVIRQRRDLVASKAQVAADAASRAAAAKRETDAAVESKNVADARKGADRAKNARKTAEDGMRQAEAALTELKQLSQEVVRKVDNALYEQDRPSKPVVLPMPPPTPPPREEEIEEPTTLEEPGVVVEEKENDGGIIEKPPAQLPTTQEEGEDADADFTIEHPTKSSIAKPTDFPPALEWPDNKGEEDVVEPFDTSAEVVEITKVVPITKEGPIGKFIPADPSYEIPSPVEDSVEPWSLTAPKLPEALALQSGGQQQQDVVGLTHFDYSYPTNNYYSRVLMKATKVEKQAHHLVYFHWDPLHHRFWISVQGDVQYVVLSKQLAYTMGFDTQRLHNGQVAKYLPDIAGGVRQFVVYAPKLVENSIIGNVMAPLLRVVNVTGHPGQCISTIYGTEHHYRLQGKRHPEITIEIRTLLGKLVKFHWGTCLLTLHFQRSLF